MSLQTDIYVAIPTLAANGVTADIALPSAGVNLVEVYLGTGATFGSGTVTIQVQGPDGVAYITNPLGTATFNAGTANSFVNRFLVYGPTMRFSLAGATSPSLDLRVRAVEVREPSALTASSPNGGSLFLPAGIALTANGATQPFVLPNYFGVTEMGLLAAGPFGGGTLALQTSPDGGQTWFNAAAGITAAGAIVLGTAQVVDLSLTANAMRLFRLNLTGATAPNIAVRVIV
jgi:hypothetical protein